VSAFRYKRPTNAAAITTSHLGDGAAEIDLRRSPKYRLVASRVFVHCLCNNMAEQFRFRCILHAGRRAAYKQFFVTPVLLVRQKEYM